MPRLQAGEVGGLFELLVAPGGLRLGGEVGAEVGPGFDQPFHAFREPAELEKGAARVVGEPFEQGAGQLDLLLVEGDACMADAVGGGGRLMHDGAFHADRVSDHLQDQGRPLGRLGLHVERVRLDPPGYLLRVPFGRDDPRAGQAMLQTIGTRGHFSTF